VWIVDFVFTRCPDICSPMTANMVKLQNELKKAGVKAELVSFSVDPKYDKPKILKQFGQNFKVDFSNWHFLTGYSQEWIQALVKNTFKNVLQNVSKNPNMPMFNHPSQWYLIDQKGQVRKIYDGLRPDYQKIVQDVKELASGK
jgi:protein SCO1/2